MKKVFIIVILLVCIISSNAQDILASTIKIGPFALDMKLQEVEVITLKKYSIDVVKKSIQDYKPIEVQLNGVKFELFFSETYDENGKSINAYKLYRIECNDSRVKTKSGITYGMDKMQVLQLVNKIDIGFTFSKYQEYDNNGKPSKKFNESLSIFDLQAGKTLYIKFKDGKVSGFSTGYEEGC